MKIIKHEDLGLSAENLYRSRYTLDDGRIIEAEMPKDMDGGPSGLDSVVESRMVYDQLTLLKYGVTRKIFYEYFYTIG